MSWIMIFHSEVCNRRTRCNVCSRKLQRTKCRKPRICHIRIKGWKISNWIGQYRSTSLISRIRLHDYLNTENNMQSARIDNKFRSKSLKFKVRKVSPRMFESAQVNLTHRSRGCWPRRELIQSLMKIFGDDEERFVPKDRSWKGFNGQIGSGLQSFNTMRNYCFHLFNQKLYKKYLYSICCLGKQVTNLVDKEFK